MGKITTAPVSTVLTSTEHIVDRFSPEPQAWVNLRDLPSEYSFDQALLICEVDPQTWVAWVPDHGEICLDRGQFYRA